MRIDLADFQPKTHGDKTFRVRASDGAYQAEIMVYAKDGARAWEYVRNAVTSENGVVFDIKLCNSTPLSIQHSEVLK